MSLDYICVKARAMVDSINKLEQDSAFALKDYQDLGSKLFPGIEWQSNNTAIICLNDFDIELTASDASLAARLCGEGADPEVIFRLAGACRENNVVIVDAQTSELVEAEGSEESVAQYKM